MIVTSTGAAHSIGYVPDGITAPRTTGRLLRATLTKRRAVDFCRVATAICPAALGWGQRAARAGASSV
jgi:hypothetical protein